MNLFLRNSQENIVKCWLYISRAEEKYLAKLYPTLVDKLQFCGQTDRSIKNCDRTFPRSYVIFVRITNFFSPRKRIPTILLLFLLHFECLPNYKSRINTNAKTVHSHVDIVYEIARRRRLLV